MRTSCLAALINGGALLVVLVSWLLSDSILKQAGVLLGCLDEALELVLNLRCCFICRVVVLSWSFSHHDDIAVVLRAARPESSCTMKCWYAADYGLYARLG